MAGILTKKKLEDADIDVGHAGEAVNTKRVIHPRYGEPFKSIPLVAEEGEAKITQAAQTITNATASIVSQKNQASEVISQAESDVATAAADVHQRGNQEIANLQNAIDIAAAAGAGANGWTAGLVKLNSGRLVEDKANDNLNLLDFFNAQERQAYNANPTIYDATIPLQRGFFASAYLKKRIDGYGEFFIADTAIISFACDLLCATFFTNIKNKSAVQVRNSDYSYIWRQELKLPKVQHTEHVTKDGWPDNSTGIEVINTLSCEITVPFVQNFHTNLKVTATLSNCYNNFYLGQLNNGKINLDVTTSPLTETARPWTNENNFFGGRYSHNGGEGTNVPGVRHIRLYSETSTLNNNVFYKPSIEASVSEYNLELACQYCKFIQPRFESDPPKVLYRKNNALSIADAQAQYNVIDGGYNSDRIVFTKQGTGAFRNRLIAPNRELNTLSSTSGGNRYVNLSGRTHAVLSVFQPEVDIDTSDFSQYSLALSSAGLRGKRATDTSDRIFVDLYNGAIVFTDGAGSTPASIARNAVGININATLHSTSTDTYDIGTPSYRYRVVYSSRYMFAATIGAFQGSGSPEGTVVAGIGSTYHRVDGGTGTCFYVKETGTGNVGWVAK